MKHRIFLSVFLLSLFVFTSGQIKKVPVFISGTEGYTSFRIPAIIKATGGDLLAFCEGRVHSSSDFGDIKIVMKRSSDRGKTWGAMQVVASNDTLQAGNPAPVLDLTDPAYPHGRIFLFYCTGNNQEGAIRRGHGVREVWYKVSADEGRSWSDPVNITTQVHRPHQPLVNPAYDFPEDWRSYATTPGHAIQLTEGKYRGRILVPINYSIGDPQPHFNDCVAGDFYTDDHGRSFHLSRDIGVPGSNEVMAAEVGPDRVMVNARNQRGDIKQRIIAFSSDGGVTWDTSYFDKHLPDPVCQGSILSVGKKNGRAIVAVCNNNDTLQRNNLTLRITFDGGVSWDKQVVVDRSDSAAKKYDYTAYSDIIQMGKEKIGVLYERNQYKEIVFAIIKWPAIRKKL